LALAFSISGLEFGLMVFDFEFEDRGFKIGVNVQDSGV